MSKELTMRNGDVIDISDSSGCEDCKRLRSGLTWTGNKPPKCPKHSETNVTYTGKWL